MSIVARFVAALPEEQVRELLIELLAAPEPTPATRRRQPR